MEENKHKYNNKYKYNNNNNISIISLLREKSVMMMYLLAKFIKDQNWNLLWEKSSQINFSTHEIVGADNIFSLSIYIYFYIFFECFKFICIHTNTHIHTAIHTRIVCSMLSLSLSLLCLHSLPPLGKLVEYVLIDQIISFRYCILPFLWEFSFLLMLFIWFCCSSLFSVVAVKNRMFSS